MAKNSLEVKINPDIIKWARESGGWSIEEISKKLKITKENFEKIEAGEKHPTFKQLETLAKYFKRPVAVFFLPKPPEEPSLSLSFRILPKDEKEFSKDLRIAIRKARYYQEILSDLMKELEIDTKPKIVNATINDDPSLIAKKEREKIRISIAEQIEWQNAYEAFNFWRTTIESKNIFVFQFKFPLEDARGFSLMDKEPAVIVINQNDNILARIFTLLHEFAHIILGITEIYTEEVITDKEVENWCNFFASEVLIPTESLINDENFKSFKYSNINSNLLENLSVKYKVSKKAILTRLRTLDLISQEVYEMEMASLKRQDISHKGGFISVPKKCLQEKGKKFISSVLQAQEKGVITIQDAIEYLSIKVKHLEKVQELISK